MTFDAILFRIIMIMVKCKVIIPIIEDGKFT
jgi:hypothetical protein